MLNALTVDVEDWYHTNGLNIPKSKWDHLSPTVYPNTVKLLDLFDEYEIKATFFILGDVAKKNPSLVKEIDRRGHEIGSHGMNHQLIHQQSMEEFKRDFFESIEILEQLTEKKIRLYRAPSWSISKDKLEVLQFLEENGIVYDSSLQPFQTPLSGINGIPTEPFQPILQNKQLHLIEFPPTVMELGKGLTFPFAGGFYLRFFPFFIISYLLGRINKKKPGLVYVHPWEIDPNIPKWKTSWLIKIIQYYRLHSTERKLRRLFKQFRFAPIGEVAGQQQVIQREI